MPALGGEDADACFAREGGSVDGDGFKRLVTNKILWSVLLFNAGKSTT